MKIDTPNINIGQRIKGIRVSKGMTLEAFGKQFNPRADKSLVSKWERGKSLPNNKRIKRIAELGNVSVLYLLEGKHTTSDIHRLPEDEQDKLKKELNELASTVNRDVSSNLTTIKNQYLKFFENYSFENLNFFQTKAIMDTLKIIYKYPSDTSIFELYSILNSDLMELESKELSNEEHEKLKKHLHESFNQLVQILDNTYYE